MPELTSPSQATLVDGDEGTVTYTFTNDNPANTTLFAKAFGGAIIHYTVVTEFVGKTITHVRNADGEAIASLEWREVLSDKVTFKNGKSQALNSWLKSGFLPLSPVTFQDEQSRKYEWKNFAPGLEMQLYVKDGSNTPIAAFKRSRRIPNTEGYTPASITLAPRAIEIADICIASFLFLERKRRAKEIAVQSHAESAAASALAISTSNFASLN